MPEASLADKVVLVTGAAQRIGAALARALHAEGARLAIHYHNSDRAAHALQAELLAQRPDSVILLRGDLHHGARLAKNLVTETVTAFNRMDVLINNASRFYPTPVGETDEEQWNDLLGTNLKAPFFLAQSAAPHLRKQQGCIINMADVYGNRPLGKHTVYCTAKAALVMLTQSLARELAPEVRVNAIAPGAILWPEGGLDEMSQQRIVSRTPLKRTGSLEDIQRAVIFLIRDAPFVTGQVLVVDGGRSIVV